MKVAIIGAGFGGLAAALRLSKEGIDTTVYELEDLPGGLAIGFNQSNWDWSFEKHYHHWFTNDLFALDLAKEIGQEVIIPRPKTSTFLDGEILQLDSPITLLQFQKLAPLDRLRTGTVLAYLKFTPFWKPLENITAKKFIIATMGRKSWETLWRPLFEKKFANYASEISAAWYWTRINKRTPSLAYPKGGFLKFAQRLDEAARKSGAKIHYKTKVTSIKKTKTGFTIVANGKRKKFDRVICTLPSPLYVRLVEGLPKKYQKSLLDLNGIGAINLVLSLKKQFLDDGSYWLNINELDYPFLAVVEHTNFMDKRHYGGDHLLYVGNYLPPDHKYFGKSANELVKIFLPYLKKINPKFQKSWIKKSWAFKAPFAQPVIPLRYSQKLPPMTTPIKGLYLANIQQVYPWDRGTNYAIELGQKAADLVLQSK